MAVTPKQVLTDPRFQKFTPEQRIQILTTIDPNFAGLTPEQQKEIVNFIPPLPSVTGEEPTAPTARGVGAIPPGEIRATTPLRARVSTARQTGREAMEGLANWLRNNLDVIGGTIGGTLGTAAGPPGAIAGAMLGGAAGRAGTQLSRFAEGRPMKSTAEAIEDMIGGGTYQGAFEAGGERLARLSKLMGPSAARRTALLAYAARGGEMGEKITKVLPDLDRAVAVTGVPKTVGELGNVTREAERTLNTDFALALQPIAGMRVAPVSVRDEILRQITPDMAQTAEGRKMAAYLTQRAQEFNREWTMRQLNAQRETMSKRLRAWHAAEASGQTAQARTRAQIAADTAAERALRDLVYDQVERSGNLSPGFIRDLKRRQSYLIDFSDAVDAARERLVKQSLERKGAPITQKVHLRTYLHPGTLTPGGVTGISPTAFRDPLKAANKRVVKAFKQGFKPLSQQELNALPLRVLFPLPMPVFPDVSAPDIPKYPGAGGGQ